MSGALYGNLIAEISSHVTGLHNRGEVLKRTDCSGATKRKAWSTVNPARWRMTCVTV